MNPNELTLAEARDALKAKRISARELTQAHLDAIGKARILNAFIRETPDRALAMADAADETIASGAARPLEGIPLGIKDLFCTDGVITTAGSKILETFEPHYESAVTANLWRDGAVMLGKLNLDAFAMGSSNETSAYGNVVSPWRRAGSDAPLVPGRLLGRFRRGGRRATVPGRDRHRHRRLDPPARRLHRHGRDQADLRALLALGHGGLRLVARSGRPDRPDGARLRDPARLDGRRGCPRHDLRRSCRCPTSRRRSAAA